MSSQSDLSKWPDPEEPREPSGDQDVDFIGKLGFERPLNLIVTNILQYLEPKELTTVCCVNKTWEQVLLNDMAANGRRTQYLEEIKKLKASVGQENWPIKSGGKDNPQRRGAFRDLASYQKVSPPPLPFPARETFSTLAVDRRSSRFPVSKWPLVTYCQARDMERHEAAEGRILRLPVSVLSEYSKTKITADSILKKPKKSSDLLNSRQQKQHRIQGNVGSKGSRRNLKRL